MDYLVYIGKGLHKETFIIINKMQKAHIMFIYLYFHISLEQQKCKNEKNTITISKKSQDGAQTHLFPEQSESLKINENLSYL